MSSITVLKEKINTKTSTMLWLTIATAGIYPLLWIYRNNPIISETTGAKTVDDGFIFWLAACYGLSQTLMHVNMDDVMAMGALLSIIANILYVIVAFKMKSALQEYALQKHKLDLRMNTFYTLIFSVYYVNFCINDLDEVERKQRILDKKEA